MTRPAVRVVVAGGGTAGWIAATALVRQLGRLVAVTLIESDGIGTVGVGESTIPTARTFHDYLKIDERSFVQKTGSSFKLGISFENWARPGDRYFHSFGTMALRTWAADFQHFWLAARQQGAAAPIADYYPEAKAAIDERFALGGDPALNYAYHLDAARYARFLRQIAETDGAIRREGRIARVEQDGTSGAIAALHLEDGSRIAGDLFIDCTGFRGLLIEQTLKAGYESWAQWLPTDAAWAVQTRAVDDAVPYTRAIAHDAGWRWRIPLQHRVGNGSVFCTAFKTQEAARADLLAAIEGETLIEPRLIRYTAGKRRVAWSHNCVALGLASGFVEPLESTSIHLIMIGITRLIRCFPFDGICPAQRAQFNRLAETEIERIRDFIVLHYKLTERDDSEFWRHCRAMAIPDTLRARIACFADGAQAWQAADELFRVDSWIQVMIGQRLMPHHWHRLAELMAPGQLADALDGVRTRIARRVAALPRHQAFLDEYCGPVMA